MSQFHCVRRRGSVWFRDELLWYDRGWIPVLVVLKKPFHNRQKKSEDTSKHTHCNASLKGERVEGLQSINITYYIYIYIFFPFY